MTDKAINKMSFKGLSIFQASLLSYLAVGIMVMAVLGGGFLFHEQDTIKQELRDQFSNSLDMAASYFDNAYGLRISQDLTFIQKSGSFSAYLSSTPSEEPFAKSLLEQLFLNFTNNIQGLYLSARFIDENGRERIVTEGDKRLRNYIDIDEVSPKDKFYSKIKSLYNDLKSSPSGTILFQGPFLYNGKQTVLVGAPMFDPEIGGFAGVVIVHCDLQDYFTHLDRYILYGEHLAAVYGLDGKLIYLSGGNKVPLSQYPLLHSKKQTLGIFYQKSTTTLLGEPKDVLFQVVFSIPSKVFSTKMQQDLKAVFPFLTLIVFLIIVISYLISLKLSRPLGHLVNIVRRLGQGEYSARSKITVKGELGVVFETFNKMAEDLVRHKNHLEEIVKERTNLLQASEKRLTKLNNAFLHFSANPLTNITLLTGLCGELLGASFSFYSRLREDKLYFLKGWQTPEDFSWDNPMGHICYDVIKKGGHELVIIQDLQNTGYAKTDPKVLKFGLNTYIGMPVNYKGICLGVICLVYKNTFIPNEEEKKVIGILATAISVEESRFQAEEMLREAKQKADIASLSKSQFLANMSHEIRTPMNAVIGFSDILQGTPLNDVQKHYVNTIKNSGDVLLSLINDILDISKIEANSLQLEKISFDLEYLTGSLLKIISARIQNKNIDLLLDYLPGAPIFYLGDPTRVRQIVLNLLSNAVKFTEKGEVKVTISVPDAHVGIGGLQTVKISVKDTGIGISCDKMGDIFELFTQADESTTRKFGGSGLGLSIARALAKKMGGDIEVRSVLGQGSEFIATLQLNIAKPVFENNISLVDTATLKGKKIAIVDDNHSGLDILEKYCKDMGMDVVFLGDRSQKLLVWLLEQKALPEIVISDIMMPESDGMTLAKQLKNEERYKNIKLIAATSDARPGTAHEAHQAGFDAYLPKPIIRQELVKIIQAVLGDKRQEKEIITRHNAEELSLKGMRVLIVEDNLSNQEMIKIYMDMFGCISEVVNNGMEAVENVRKNSYDVCLMDMQMPVMGGIEATKIIRRDINNNIPIIALTAAAMKEDKESGLNSGMNDYLTKPIDPEKLKEVLYRWRHTNKNIVKE